MSAVSPGTVITGKVSWFGGPNDPTAGSKTASGKPISQGGIAVLNHDTLGGYWQLTFPNGRTVIEQQTDYGPASFTGRMFDVAYSSLAGAGYTEANFPTDATVRGVYLGKNPTSSPSSPPASSSTSSPGASASGSSDPGGLVSLAVHGWLYLVLLAGAGAMLWIGFKTTTQPRKPS